MFLSLCLAFGCSRSTTDNAVGVAPSSSPSAALAAAPSGANPAGQASAVTAPPAEPTPPPAAPAAEAPPGGAVAQKPTVPAAAGGGTPKTFACGAKGQPPCPTQAWMKANMAPAVASEDGPALAKAFDYIAAHAPSEMPNWASIAKGGAASSRKGDIDAAKGACKACHDQYKAKYKAEIRDRPF